MKQTGTPSALRRRAALPLAIISYALMLAGLVSVALWSVGLVRGVIANTSKKEEYEDFIRPIVMMDPIPFDDISAADPAFVREAALWAAVVGDQRDSFAVDDLGMLLVPATDVSVAAAKLFGPEASVEHASFDDMDGTYLYDPEIAAYRVPPISKNAYSPSVESITKEGETILLRVGYVAPGTIWTTQRRDSQGKILSEKAMRYRLTKTKSGYYVSAVEDVETPAVPGA